MDAQARDAIYRLCQILAEAISFCRDVSGNERVYIKFMDRIAEVQDELQPAAHDPSLRAVNV